MSASVRHDLVVLACATSAGIHAALAPAHRDEAAAAGGGFVAAAAVLALLAVCLTRRPDAHLPVAAAAATLAGLLASYLAAATTGLPSVHPQPEPVTAVALVTKTVEAAGLAAAASLLARRRVPRTHPEAEGA